MSMKIFIETLDSLNNKIYPYSSMYSNLKIQKTNSTQWHIYVKNKCYIDVLKMRKLLISSEDTLKFSRLFWGHVYAEFNSESINIVVNNIKYTDAEVVLSILNSKNFYPIDLDKVKNKIELLL